MYTRYRTIVVLAVTLVAATFGTTRGQDALTLQNSVTPLLGQKVFSTEYVSGNPAALNSIVTMTGANQTWDITGGQYATSQTDSMQYLAPPFDGLPGADRAEFADANFVQVISQIISQDIPQPVEAYNYSSAADSGIVHYGFSAAVDYDQNGSIDTVSVIFDPPELDTRFPASIGTEWNSETTQKFALPSATYSGATITRTASVIGSGTLVTPDGSADVFMIDRTYVSAIAGINSISTHSIDFEGPLQSSSGKSSGVMTIYASLTLTPTNTVAGASYTVLTTAGGGGSSTATEQQGEIPETISLGANYPNPFNPSTSIPFTVKQDARVSLAVYDVLGRQVDLLFDRFMAAGDHKITWQADNLPSGVYQVVLRSGAESRVRTMILQK